MIGFGSQVLMLPILAIPIACISWTVTHEEIFREPREWFLRKSERSRHFYQRKFFHILTCEYCFSHYVALFFLLVFRFTLGYPGGAATSLAGLLWSGSQMSI